MATIIAEGEGRGSLKVYLVLRSIPVSWYVLLLLDHHLRVQIVPHMAERTFFPSSVPTGRVPTTGQGPETAPESAFVGSASFPCAQGYTEDRSGSSSGNIPSAVIAEGRRCVQAKRIQTHSVPAAAAGQSSNSAVVSEALIAPFARIRHETGGGYVSGAHMQWGGRVSILPSLSQIGRAESMRRVEEVPVLSNPVSILPKHLSPVRFRTRTAEHQADLRDNSEDDTDDEIQPVSTNHLHRLLPPVPPQAPSSEELRIPSPRDGGLYLSNRPKSF